MDGNEIGLFEDSLKIDQFEAARKVSIRVDVRIISDDVHRHRLALARHFTADASEADDTQCFSSELDALELALLPFMALERFVCLGNIAGHRKKHCHGMLGGRGGRSAWRVHD